MDHRAPWRWRRYTNNYVNVANMLFYMFTSKFSHLQYIYKNQSISEFLHVVFMYFMFLLVFLTSVLSLFQRSPMHLMDESFILNTHLTHCSQRRDKLTEETFCYAWGVNATCLIFSHQRAYVLYSRHRAEREESSTSLRLSSLHYSSIAALLRLL